MSPDINRSQPCLLRDQEAAALLHPLLHRHCEIHCSTVPNSTPCHLTCTAVSPACCVYQEAAAAAAAAAAAFNASVASQTLCRCTSSLFNKHTMSPDMHSSQPCQVAAADALLHQLLHQHFCKYNVALLRNHVS
jgi:hypothetical protein